jgi:hypothetical protein
MPCAVPLARLASSIVKVIGPIMTVSVVPMRKPWSRGPYGEDGEMNLR